MSPKQPFGPRTDLNVPLFHHKGGLTDLNRPHTELRVARVVRVDYENMLVDVVFEDSVGSRVEIPVAYAGASQRAMSVVVPELNSIVLVGFARYFGSLSSAYIVTTLSFGHRSRVNFRPYKSQTSKDPRVRRFRGRKLYPGDVYHASSRGSEIHLDYDVKIEGPSFDTIRIREEDGALITRSLQTYTANTAVRTWSGVITRDDFEILDPELDVTSEGVEGPLGEIRRSGLPYSWTSSGRKHCHVTLTGEALDDQGVPFVEWRASVEELSNATRPVTAETHDFDFQMTDPRWRQDAHQLMEMTVGTLVGDDPIYEESRYGHVLVPSLLKRDYWFEADGEDLDKPNIYEHVYTEGAGWSADEDAPGYLWEEPLAHDSQLDKKLATAAAIRFRMRNEKSGMAYFALTKEGKAYLHLGRSSGFDDIGEGRSLEMATEGSVKVVLGRNTDEGHSLWLATRGSVVQHIGSSWPTHNARYRDKAGTSLYHDGSAYGGHGYHDLTQIAAFAPLESNNANSDPEKEAYSVDRIIDRNVHMIVGWDASAGDKKSITLDTAGSVVAALGKDKLEHSMVLEFDGSLEGQVGKNTRDLRSVNLACLGGVQIHVDDGDAHLGQSLHVELAKGLSLSIDGPDGGGDAFNLKFRGNLTIQGHGDQIKISLSAAQAVEMSVVAPAITRVLQGSVTDFVIGDYKLLVTGNRVETVMGEDIKT